MNWGRKRSSAAISIATSSRAAGEARTEVALGAPATLSYDPLLYGLLDYASSDERYSSIITLDLARRACTALVLCAQRPEATCFERVVEGTPDPVRTRTSLAGGKRHRTATAVGGLRS